MRAFFHDGKGVVLQSSSLIGMLALRLLAALHPLRRRSLRFAREQRANEAWLDAVASALSAGDAARALEVAQLPWLRKGYGETHAAGEAAFDWALHVHPIKVVR
jgi:indolepyruvate ferredoxin oxidoreductase beta subunit